VAGSVLDTPVGDSIHHDGQALELSQSGITVERRRPGAK
jgi:hypothetical protein